MVSNRYTAKCQSGVTVTGVGDCVHVSHALGLYVVPESAVPLCVCDGLAMLVLVPEMPERMELYVPVLSMAHLAVCVFEFRLSETTNLLT